MKYPKLEGNICDKVEHLLEWIDSKISIMSWDNEDIRQKFAKRGANKIINEGHVCYMNPCLDYNLVILEILKNNDIDSNLVMEELESPTYKHTRLHFAVELFDKEQYFIEFMPLKSIYLCRGKYSNSMKDINSIDVFRLDASQIDPNKAIYENFGFTNLEEMESMFKDFSLAPQLEKIYKDNTQATYNGYLKKLGTDSKFKFFKFDLEKPF